jgi:hypothetical protein
MQAEFSPGPLLSSPALPFWFPHQAAEQKPGCGPFILDSLADLGRWSVSDDMR